MIDLPHHHARALIHADTDQIIDPAQKRALAAHLAKCRECNQHAKSLTDLEASLRSNMHSAWDRQRPNVDLAQIMNPPLAKFLRAGASNLTQSAGKATAIALFFLGCLMLANHVNLQIPGSNKRTPTALPTPRQDAPFLSASPTPSTPIQITSTGNIGTQVCADAVYVIQRAGDTAHIADMLRIPEYRILEYNNLSMDSITPGTKLYIPRCDSAPAHTPSLPSTTFTITPGNGTLSLNEFE